MKPSSSFGQTYWQDQTVHLSQTQQILNACAELPLLTGSIQEVRQYVADAVRSIFRLDVAGLLFEEGDVWVPCALSNDHQPRISNSAFVSQAGPFAARAIQQGEIVGFHFPGKPGAEGNTCLGLAQPLVTAQSAMVLVALRSSMFSKEEESGFRVLGGVARMALENRELRNPSATGQEHWDYLLEAPAQLTAASRLDTFLQMFVLRAAEFLGYERAFVAVAEGDQCRIRWDCMNGISRRVDTDVSSARSTRHMIETRTPFVASGVELNPAELPGSGQNGSRESQYLGVPLLTGDGRMIGILGLLERKAGGEIRKEDIDRAKALAEEVAVVLEATRNLHLSEQHRKRAQDLMEMALDLGSALRLPEFVRNFTVRVASMMQAKSAVLALAQGSKVECISFFGMEPERDVQRILGMALSEYAASHPDLKITGSGLQALHREAAKHLAANNLTLVRLEGAEGDLLGILGLGDISRELLPGDLYLLQALIGHASVALDNSRLFTRITQSSRQWAEIFDSITDYIVVHDDQHRVLRVNRSLADFIGVPPPELIGLSMRALISISSDGQQPCPFCRAGDADEYLHPVVERTYLVSTSRVHGALNEGLQTIHVLKDITDRREAERRYRELFDNVQEGVFFASPEGRFIEVNDALVRMLGYQAREEVLKLDLATQVYLFKQQREEITRHLHKFGAVRNFEVTLSRRDGTLIHALENTFVVREAQGRVLQYRGVFLDITEVKNFQAQLQRERDFTSKILNNTQTMIMVADTAGLISYANRRCYESGGFDRQALVGNRLGSIIPASHRKEFEQAFEASLRGMQVDNLELMIARGNGSQGKFSINLSPMRDESSDVNSVVVLMTDITDASMIQAKLMHTEKMAAVGQLVSGVAHEVNNPLTAIMGFSDLLMENPEIPEIARKDLQVILEEAQRTKEIVQNLLSFARRRPPQRQPLLINNLLRKTIALRSYDFANHSVDVSERFDENLPELVADSHQLQQVFLNILNNAYDAVRTTGRSGKIEIVTRHDRGWVEVTFRDNGEGIQHPERIFDPFFTTKQVGEGTGLGLSICYGIVREHEGEILCGNNQDMPGATFTVRLPVTTAEGDGMFPVQGGRL
ncbi:MAG TPA: PAS domain S-box protein [Candidatus Angelobacter sp.]|nr:PAS domain S-box protein [Candidatus Angelobacter sp.]